MNLAFTLFVSFLGLFTRPATVSTGIPDHKANTICCTTNEVTWKTEYEDQQVIIESGIAVYSGKNNEILHERVVFRYTNRTSKNIQLSFGRKMMYNGVCYGCDKADKLFLVDLKPGEIKEYSEENKDKTFYIFSKDLKKTIQRTLDSFEITNIQALIQ
jgi:hypothetical protein